jgi:fido (protein-threonine AMPylation protein)
MNFSGEKLAVFRQLEQEVAPISLKGLLAKLGPNFKERSVRRWLAEMVEQGWVERIGNRRASLYRVLQVANRQSVNSCFGSESLSVIAWVRKPIYERPPVAYADEWFEAYQPNQTFYIPAKIRAQLYQEGKRVQREDPAGTYAHQIFNRLLIDLSYNSSRLEGNTYSLVDTQRLVLEGKGVEGKLDEEKVMILNHKEAIRYLVDKAPYITISIQTICTLHYLLGDGLVEVRHAGKIRDHGVRIGGSTYIPFENPKKIEIQLERIVEKASLIEDPYEQSFFLLVHITYLQPFTDVNKRTARLSANIPLVKHNLVPLSFNDVEREDYTAAVIAIYELQDVRPLVDLYAFSYLRTCAAYDSTVKAIGFDEVRVRYRAQRRAVLREIMVRHLHGDSLKTYLASQAVELVAEKDRSDFIQDVEEDLEQMDESRILGLGITLAEFKNWRES